MFTSVRIQNYRSLREVDVPLGPLTVAIGANNTGKSTFLTAVGAAVSSSGLWKLGDHDGFQAGGGAGSVQLAPVLGSPLTPFKVQLPATGPTMRTPGVQDHLGAPELASNGQNVAALVDWMLRRDRTRFFAFVDAACALIPGLKDLHISTPTAAERRIDLEAENGWTHPADEGSAGVRLLLFFLALAWHPTPPDVVLIEEPENGLHPARLREVMALIRGLVDGVHAPKRIQVVLTTHSPYLLSCVRVPDDQVLVFSRGADGACTAQPLDAERLAPFLEDFALGELWSNLGEAGLVKA